MSFIRTSSVMHILIGVGIGFGFFTFFGDRSISKDIHPEDIFSSQKIENAKDIIRKEYYHFDEKTKLEIEDGMIEALVRSLGDKHSSYFPPKEAKEFQEMLEGDFEGIGAVIDNHPRGIIIRKVIKDSPAKRAGLQDGDIITYVGTESMVGVEVQDAVKKIRGKKGTIVRITYTREDQDKTIDVTRDTISIPSVESQVFTGSNLGYIQVAYFGENTTQEFEKNLKSVLQKNPKGILLDFRDNGGGFLNVAVEILSLLLPEGTQAVTTRENDPKKMEVLRTIRVTSTNTEIPLIMLVNAQSASATEIVAGALQDHGRAIILGEKTYGKGSVQVPFLLDDGSIIKITTGRWYTPKDKSIDKNGITPDVFIPLFEKDYINKYDRQLEEAKALFGEYLDNPKDRQKIIDEYAKKTYKP